MQILCIAELSKRLASAKVEDKIKVFMIRIHCRLLYGTDAAFKPGRDDFNLFNGKNKVIKELTVSVGTVNQTVASPRELFLEHCGVKRYPF